MHFSSEDLPLSSFLKWMPVRQLFSSGCGGGIVSSTVVSSAVVSSLAGSVAACALRAHVCSTFLVTAEAMLLATCAAVVLAPCLATVSAALAAAAEKKARARAKAPKVRRVSLTVRNAAARASERAALGQSEVWGSD